jgi:hypothetical protein
VAAMAIYGKIEEFELTSDFDVYTDRLKNYFTANEITEEAKKRAILLSVCDKHYIKFFVICCSQTSQKKLDMTT